jgi:Xaa-Pro dipeptidase
MTHDGQLQFDNMKQDVGQALLIAQRRAEQLFQLVVDEGLIRAGLLESELSKQIYALASERSGARRHWHRRIVRAGPNSVLGYHADPPDRRIEEDDSVYLDFGPVFGEWEADFGRTYVVGNDPRKHQLVADIESAFRAGNALYLREPDLTTGALYDFVSGLAEERGWDFGAPTAGHLIGHFPHETMPGEPRPLSIRPGNTLRLRETYYI